MPVNQSAVLNFIGEHLNQERTTGAAFIALDGDEIILDGLEMKNVILRNVSVRYYGSPVMMDNVYFVNCTFTFPPQTRMPMVIRQFVQNLTTAPPEENRQLFAEKILESPSVTFTTS